MFEKADPDFGKPNHATIMSPLCEQRVIRSRPSRAEIESWKFKGGGILKIDPTALEEHEWYDEGKNTLTNVDDHHILGGAVLRESVAEVVERF